MSEKNNNWMVRGDVLENYLMVCQDAVNDDNCFDNFKRDPKYTTILEHCNSAIANNYLINISNTHPYLLSNDFNFQLNDNIGNPMISTFINREQKYLYSNSTMQYIGVLSNLMKELNIKDSFRNWNIVEIGGGYGGQAVIMKEYESTIKYSIIDLLEPSLLQDKYLERLGIEDVNCYSTEDYPNNKKYDLVISNYALSEVLEPLQTKYIEEICLNSKHGYITCNVELKSFDLLKEKFPHLRIEKDVKGEVEKNFIIIW